MVRVGVVGASGYTGVELLRLISAHPEFDLAIATADSNAGTRGVAARAVVVGGVPRPPIRSVRRRRDPRRRTRSRLPRPAPRGRPWCRAAARRPGRVRRRSLGGVPAPRSGRLSALVRVHPRSARAAPPRRLRPPRTHSGRSRRRPAGRHARVLRHRRDAGPRSAARRRVSSNRRGSSSTPPAASPAPDAI